MWKESQPAMDEGRRLMFKGLSAALKVNLVVVAVVRPFPKGFGTDMLVPVLSGQYDICGAMGYPSETFRLQSRDLHATRRSLDLQSYLLYSLFLPDIWSEHLRFS